MTNLEIVLEYWKELEYPDIRPLYEISNLGNVRNKITGKEISQHESEKGYIMVGLMSISKGRQKTKKLHRIAAYNFLRENYSEEMTVDHISGDKKDNSVDNLEYVSFEENIQRSFKNGQNAPRKGTLNGRNKYPIESIERACVLLKEGNLSVPKIVDLIKSEGGNISFHMVHDIKRGKAWTDVSSRIWK